MLQQTRVEQALPYYNRFLRRFPNMKRLAAASLGFPAEAGKKRKGHGGPPPHHGHHRHHRKQKILLKNCYAVLTMDPSADMAGADILIQDGKILAIGKHLGRGDKTIDCSSLIAMPGFVTTHHHKYETPQRSANADGYIVLDEHEEGLEPEDRSVIALSQDGDFSLTPGMDETRFLLGKHTVPYFDKFVNGRAENGKVTFYNLPGDSNKQTTVNHLWFSNPQFESFLNAWGRNLDYDIGTFGVLRTGEASASKNGHSITDIKNANSETVKEVLGGTPVLEKALENPLTQGLLKRLRKE